MAQETEAARWFTRARRIPILIGRAHDGSRIPGGPYTIGQVIAAAIALFVMWKTATLWAHFGWVTNATVFIGVVAGVVILVGKLPRGGRNPLSWAAGFLALYLRTPGGTVGGRPLRVTPPRKVQHRIVMPVATLPTSTQDEDDRGVQPATAEQPSVDPTPVAAQAAPQPPRTAAPAGAQVQLTAVGRLLAVNNAEEDS
ncbi:hypothetical protein ACQFYA_20910 [Promicromonospora sp. Marseille-Q5078]